VIQAGHTTCRRRKYPSPGTATTPRAGPGNPGGRRFRGRPAPVCAPFADTAVVPPVEDPARHRLVQVTAGLGTTGHDLFGGLACLTTGEGGDVRRFGCRQLDRDELDVFVVVQLDA